jgi:hypothetical protein
MQGDYTLSIDVTHQFAKHTWHVDVTLPRLFDLWEQLTNDSRGAGDFDTLIDLRAVHVALTPDEVRQLGNGSKRHAASRRAIVTGNDHDFGMMRMLELVASFGPRHYAVFHSIEDACLWLGNPGCS